MTADDIIRIFGMERLPGEGGYYTETYRSGDIVQQEALASRYSGSRACSTVIYYLVTPTDCSKLHRVTSDEIFCFHKGEPIKMLLLFPDGRSETVVVGADIQAGQVPQIIVPAGTWQGAYIDSNIGLGYSLLSCIVAPGFEFADYEQGSRSELLELYPDEAVLVNKLT